MNIRGLIIAFVVLFSPVALFAATGGLDFDQLQSISTDTILGRDTAGTGNIEQLATSTVATFLDALQKGNNLSDLSATSTAIGNLGLTIGTDVQAYDDELRDVASSTPTKGDLLTSDGTDWLDFVVGTDGQLLMASSTASNGVSWETGSSLWTDAGSFTFLMATTDDLVLGSSATSTAPVWIDVSASSTMYAVGGVLDFGDGDVTLAHTANTLTLGGGNLDIDVNTAVFDAALAASDKILSIEVANTEEWNITREATRNDVLLHGTNGNIDILRLMDQTPAGFGRPTTYARPIFLTDLIVQDTQGDENVWGEQLTSSYGYEYRVGTDPYTPSGTGRWAIFSYASTTPGFKKAVVAETENHYDMVFATGASSTPSWLPSSGGFGVPAIRIINGSSASENPNREVGNRGIVIYEPLVNDTNIASNAAIPTINDPTGNTRAVQLSLQTNAISAANAQNAFGLMGGVQSTAANTQNRTGYFASVYGHVGWNSTTGTLTWGRGFFTDLPTVAAGKTITNYAGAYIDVSGTPSGAITNLYGIYIPAVTAGATIDRAIYVAGGTSEFDGDVMLNVTDGFLKANSTGVIATSTIETDDISATGTPSATVFLRGDGQWASPSGSGDVTGVGDCTSGDCLDGTFDAGTFIRLYDGDSNYAEFLTPNIVATTFYTFPSNASNTIMAGQNNLSDLSSTSTARNTLDLGEANTPTLGDLNLSATTTISADLGLGGYLVAGNNLSDVSSTSTSRNNLTLGEAQIPLFGDLDLTATSTIATKLVLADFLVKSNNFSDVSSTSTARNNLTLGEAQIPLFGDLDLTATSTLSVKLVLSDFLVKSNNLSDLSATSTACTNLLGDAGLCDGNDADTGGATAWDNIGDPTLAGTIAFAGTTQTITGNTDNTTAITQDLLSLSFTNDAVTDILTQRVLVITNAAGVNGMEAFIALDNADTDDVVTDALLITSAAGLITTALNVSDAEIGTALAIGANDITTSGATISAAELNRLDGLAGTIVTDTTAVTEVDGAYLTIGAGTLGLDAEISDDDKTFVFQGTGFVASSTLHIVLKNAVTLQRVDCTASANASSTLQMNNNNVNTPETASTTNLLSAELTSGGGTAATTTSFATTVLDADTVLQLVLNDASSTGAYPDKSICTVFYSVND